MSLGRRGATNKLRVINDDIDLNKVVPSPLVFGCIKREGALSCPVSAF